HSVVVCRGLGRSLHGRGVVSSVAVGRRWRAPQPAYPTVPTSRNKCRPTVRGCAQCGCATPPCPYRESADHYRRGASNLVLLGCPPRTDQTTSQSWNLAAAATNPDKRSGLNPD